MPRPLFNRAVLPVSLRSITAWALMVAGLWLAVPARADVRPNILLIMADDLGFSDLGCYGGEIETPNLDRLADRGLRFTQFYNTGRCWPTRGSLLTGYYAQQIRRDFLPGIAQTGNRGKRPEWARLLPEYLRQVGYRSYHTGKWHIDGKPTDNGFDVSSVTQVGRYFQPVPGKDGKQGRPLEFRDDFYLTSAMAEQVIANLRQHQTQHAGQPFFQYLAFTAPHFPLHALPEDIAKYDATYDVGWDAIRSRRWQRMQAIGLLDQTAHARPSSVERDLGPPYHFPDAFSILGPAEINRPQPWNRLDQDQREFQAAKMAIHAAMVDSMDQAIGRVVKHLRNSGQLDNTVVLFLSDNGASAEIMVRGDGHDPDAPLGSAKTYLCLGPGWSTTCNTPYRRHKTWTHEGGIATPMIVHWPQGISDRGSFRRNPHHVIDVVPTLLEIAGASKPESAPQSPGTSFVAELTGAAEAEQRTLWWFHDGHRAIRKGDWKAVAAKGESWELYDLAKDRIESTDLAIARPTKLSELTQAWNQQLQATIELARQDLPPRPTEAAANEPNRGKMRQAQQAARVQRSQVLPRGETFQLGGRHAFILHPEQPAAAERGKPWIFYAPALPPYPDKHEQWMHEQFLAAGIAVAGIDIGEAYGSPQSVPHFDALYNEMQRRGFSDQPALLGRSRGGLWVSRFALAHPERIAGIAGIYPVFDYTTYPGTERAASAYAVDAETLQTQQDKFNPVRSADRLAAADLPIYIIHGTEDKVVPIEPNSAAIEAAYQRAGKAELIQLQRVDGQGHNFWPGFFRCQPLIDFLIDAAK